MWISGLFLLGLALLSFLVGIFASSPSIAGAWAEIDANSLVGFQGFIDQWLDPDPGNPTIWFDYVLPVLGMSVFHGAAALLAVIGAIVLLVGRMRA